MKNKIISQESAKEEAFDFVNIQLIKVSLENKINLFVETTAARLVYELLKFKKNGYDLKILFSEFEGLEFLASETKPEIDDTNPETKKLSTAQKSIYTCLDKLNKTNKARIQEVLARDFENLGFESFVYAPKEPGWLGEELQEAAKVGDILEIEKLLNNGVDIEAKDSDGWTALFFASSEGETECVDLLLKVGAKIDAKTNDENTALDFAKKNNHIEVVRLLEAAIEDQS